MVPPHASTEDRLINAANSSTRSYVTVSRPAVQMNAGLHKERPNSHTGIACIMIWSPNSHAGIAYIMIWSPNSHTGIAYIMIWSQNSHTGIACIMIWSPNSHTGIACIMIWSPNSHTGIAYIMIWSPQLRQTDRQTKGEAKLTCRYSMHHDMVPTAQTDRQTDTRRGQTHIQV